MRARILPGLSQLARLVVPPPPQDRVSLGVIEWEGIGGECVRQGGGGGEEGIALAKGREVGKGVRA